jgi:hypothetical protein
MFKTDEMQKALDDYSDYQTAIFVKLAKRVEMITDPGERASRVSNLVMLRKHIEALNLLRKTDFAELLSGIMLRNRHPDTENDDGITWNVARVRDVHSAYDATRQALNLMTGVYQKAS